MIMLDLKMVFGSGRTKNKSHTIKFRKAILNADWAGDYSVISEKIKEYYNSDD